MNKLIEDYIEEPGLEKKQEILQRQKLLADQFMQSHGNKINQANSNDESRLEYNLASNPDILKTSKNLMIDPKTLANFYEMHFSENPRATPVELNLNFADLPEKYQYLNEVIENFRSIKILDVPPTEEELRDLLWDLPNNRCMGTDKIYLESLRYGVNSPSFIKNLKYFFDQLWEIEEIPYRWRNSQITSLYKKGEISNPQSYRAISIYDTMSRILPILAIKSSKNSP